LKELSLQLPVREWCRLLEIPRSVYRKPDYGI